jgi:sortase B
MSNQLKEAIKEPAYDKRPGDKQGFIWGIIPRKGDKPLEITRKIVFAVSIVVAVVCFMFVFGDMWASQRNNSLNNELAGSRERVIEAVSGNITFISAEHTAEPDEIDLVALSYELAEFIDLTQERILEILIEVPGILPELIETYNRNSDLVGWLNIDGTRINYPVLQYRRYNEDGSVTGDNAFYLYRTIDGRNSAAGSIYADWWLPFTPTFRPNNTVLYGHNVGDGSMFAAVTRYYSYHSAHGRGGSIQFYLNNPLIYFDTLYDKGEYKVFAAMYVHTQENRFDDVFDYFRWRSFPDRDTFYAFMVNVLDRSTFYTDVDLRYGDEILTLSTCYYPLGTDIDSRIAVFARRVRPGESSEVNLDVAYLNPSPLYFDRWYRAVGGSWEGRNWDTSKVEGLDAWLAERGDEEIPLLYREKQAEIAARNTVSDDLVMYD